MAEKTEDKKKRKVLTPEERKKRLQKQKKDSALRIKKKKALDRKAQAKKNKEIALRLKKELEKRREEFIDEFISGLEKREEFKGISVKKMCFIVNEALPVEQAMSIDDFCKVWEVGKSTLYTWRLDPTIQQCRSMMFRAVLGAYTSDVLYNLHRGATAVMDNGGVQVSAIELWLNYVEGFKKDGAEDSGNVVNVYFSEGGKSAMVTGADDEEIEKNKNPANIDVSAYPEAPQSEEMKKIIKMANNR